MYVLNTTGEKNMWTETWPTEAPNMNWDHEQRSSQGHHLALPQQRPIKDALSVYPERGAYHASAAFIGFVSALVFFCRSWIYQRTKKKRWMETKWALLGLYNHTKWAAPGDIFARIQRFENAFFCPFGRIFRHRSSQNYFLIPVFDGILR